MATPSIFQPSTTTRLTYKYFVTIKVDGNSLAQAQTIKFGSERNSELWRQFTTDPGSTTNNPLIAMEVYPGLQTYTGSLGFVAAYDLFSFLRAIGASHFTSNPTGTNDVATINYGLDIIFQTKAVDIEVQVYEASDTSKVAASVMLKGCWFKSSNYTFDMTQNNPIIIQNTDFEFKGITTTYRT